jgi:hypothetical protein
MICSGTSGTNPAKPSNVFAKRHTWPIALSQPCSVDLHSACTATTELASECPLETTFAWMTNALLVARNRLTHEPCLQPLRFARLQRTSNMILACGLLYWPQTAINV